MKLKVGDKVKFSDQSWCPDMYLLANNEYEVMETFPDTGLFRVKCDGHTKRLILCLFEGCGHLNGNAWEKVDITEQIGILIKSTIDAAASNN